MTNSSTLLSFNYADGAAPDAGLTTDAAGDLFGTTQRGGQFGFGAVFEIPFIAGHYAAPVVLASFNGSDGFTPQAGLIADAAGDLFGTSSGGGTNGDGEVFEIAKTASGYASTPTTLASFTFGNGDNPRAGLIADAAGDLFGTTAFGGTGGDGTVFEIAKTAGGYASTPTTLFNFNTSTGSQPYGGLITDAAGDLFGTTALGGANGYGMVFEIVKTAGGYASPPTLLASFNSTDGATPEATLSVDAAGDLFGTTQSGGANGDGTVFEIAKAAGGYASTPTTLVSFDGADGSNPQGSVLVDAAGDLFGTTHAGGANGDGNVFEIAKTGGSYASTPTTLLDFSGSNGALPSAGLTADANGDLFGTTQGGGVGDGVVFELTGTGFVTGTGGPISESWQSAVSADWNTAADWTAGVPKAVTSSATITVAGNYTVTVATGESFLVNSLTFGPGAGGTLAVAGTLTLGGTLAAMTQNSGTVDLAGTITGGAVTLAGGVFDLTADAATLLAGTSLTLGSAEVLAKTGGTGTTTIGGGFINAGTVDAASGTLRLAAAVSGSGQLRIEAGQTLELAAGSVAGSNTIDFNGFGATLKLDSSSAVAGPIVGLGTGSRIDLAAATSATAVINGNTLTITPAGGSALNFVSAGSLAGLRAATAGDGGAGTVVTLYREAIAGPHSPEPVAFGNLHVGATAVTSLTVGNTAPAGLDTEKLDGALTATAAGFTAAGSFSGLAAGSSTSALSIALSTATPGSKTGTATLALFSDGTGVDGLGKTALPTQTVNVTGNVYAYAAPVFSSGTIALGAARIGGAALVGSVTLGDGTSANAYQESLIYQLATALPADLAISNLAGTLASGHTVAIGVTLGTATAVNYSNAALAAGGNVSFVSTGAGTSGLANTTLAVPALTLSGEVFAAATAHLAANVVNFGVVHVGQVVNAATLNVSNTASGALTDLLTAGTVSETGSYSGGVTESLGGGLAAGAGGSVSFALATGSAGVQSGTVDLGFLSHDAVLANLALAAVPVTVTGTVDNYATATIQALSGQAITGSGTAEVINLGTLQQNSGAVAVTLDVRNGATGQADLLAGSFVVGGPTGFSNTGFAAFSSLAAGQATGADTVTLSTASTGTFSETITLDPTGSNADYSGALAPQTLTIEALVASSQSAQRTYMLTPQTNDIVAPQGNDTFIATAGALNSSDSITGGPGGANTLELSGGGVFNLNVPKTLANIQMVDATDGQVASGAQPDTLQTVSLRGGLNVTLDVAAGTTNPLNPNPSGITVYGGNDASVINLGTGHATVVLGSAAEVVHGGGGTAHILATAATAGALVAGNGTSLTTLEITNGGTATLNADTRLATVQLDQATHLMLSKIGFLTVVGEVAGNTITAAAANETLEGTHGGDTFTGYSGFGDTFLGRAAGLNGDTIAGFGGSDKIDLTDLLPTAKIGYSGNSARGVLTLSDGVHGASITMLGNFNQGGFHVATDGHAGSFVTFT